MIQFSTLECPSFEKAKEFLDYTISRLSVQNVKILSQAKEEFNVDGKKTYAVYLDVSPVEGKAKSYQAIMFNDSTAVMFIGADNEEGKLIDKFRETVQSIRF